MKIIKEINSGPPSHTKVNKQLLPGLVCDLSDGFGLAEVRRVLYAAKRNKVQFKCYVYKQCNLPQKKVHAPMRYSKMDVWEFYEFRSKMHAENASFFSGQMTPSCGLTSYIHV